MLEIVLVAIGLLVSLLGILGCLLPVLPGPPLSFVALIIISWAKNWEPYNSEFLLLMAGLTIFVTLLDYVVPAAGARKYGASKAGVWGSVLGMLIGLVLFPPWGMFLGAFFGAMIGEINAGKTRGGALRAAWGVFMGTMVGIGLKLALSGVMLFYYIKAMF